MCYDVRRSCLSSSKRVLKSQPFSPLSSLLFFPPISITNTHEPKETRPAFLHQPTPYVTWYLYCSLSLHTYTRSFISYRKDSHQPPPANAIYTSPGTCITQVMGIHLTHHTSFTWQLVTSLSPPLFVLITLHSQLDANHTTKRVQ